MTGNQDHWCDAIQHQIEVMVNKGYSPDAMLDFIHDCTNVDITRIFDDLHAASLYEAYLNGCLIQLGYDFLVSIRRIGYDQDCEYLVTDKRLTDTILNAIKIIS